MGGVNEGEPRGVGGGEVMKRRGLKVRPNGNHDQRTLVVRTKDVVHGDKVRTRNQTSSIFAILRIIP